MQIISIDTYETVQGGGLLAEVVKLLGGEALIEGAKALYGSAGVAGPGANENDNGGTSYGIDVFNTFGG